MIEQTAAAYATTSTSGQKVAAFAEIMLGLIIIVGTGVVQAHALHECTHDTRHAFGLPCH